ncbi:Uncharacterised protein [Corynebacterium ulcerans]|nr:Uncharacterised protein [Corynebacterium ulcerans]
MVPILGLSFPHGSENNVIAATNFFHNAPTSIYAENKIYASVGFLFHITPNGEKHARFHPQKVENKKIEGSQIDYLLSPAEQICTSCSYYLCDRQGAPRADPSTRSDLPLRVHIGNTHKVRASQTIGQAGHIGR